MSVAIVTGTAGGIGGACAERLKSSGWSVAGLDIRATSGVDLSLTVDTSDPAALSAAFEQAENQLGPVDGVVSAAGYVTEIGLEHISRADTVRMLKTHVGAFATLARRAAETMSRRGRGSIVAVSSELAIGGGEDAVHYVAAKGAITGLARALSVEFAPHGIAVNVLAPGPTDTAMIGTDTFWREAEYLDTIPTRALARPSEMARVVEFFLAEAGQMSGQVVSINSGTVI